MKNRICEALGIEKPVLAASMNWLSNAEWAAAVSNAGGLGNLGFNCGQNMETVDVAETVERFRQEIRKTRELTDKPFSVTYILPVEGNAASRAFSDPIFDMFCEEMVDVIYTNNMTPLANAGEIKRIRERGIKVLHRDLSPTKESLLHADGLDVDALIVTGFEAGGHMTAHRIGLFSMLQEVGALIKTPFAAGGGICTAAVARAARVMGAQGVYVGTRLLVTEENPASDITKQAIINAKAEELIEFRAQVGYLRTNKSPMSADCDKLARAGADARVIANAYAGAWRRGMLLGDLNYGFISVSDAINSITAVKTCKEVVDELAAAFV
ncbi:MAG: nitronate monooxygenase [Clostridiales Family XIII bacterium]|jgi:enoyl-[acyl-carrier protein] reductase II|nr:nitronate monooxygenase [Clostridiales Family XIII bacterium]